MRWCAVAPGSQYFRKIDVDVQLYFGGSEIFSFLILRDTKNQNFQIKSRLRSLFSPYLK